MRTPRKDETTAILLLGAFALVALAIFAMACGPLDIDPATDSDPQGDERTAEIDRIDQASWCFGFPVKVMNFPVNQGAWKGDQAGQVSVAPFWTSACQPPGTEFAYAQEDGEINLNQTVGWAPSTCWTWKGSTGSGIVCNNQTFQCPANACITEPVTWQNGTTAPNNTMNWGWSQWSAIKSYLSEAPGNHGIWPKTPTQCSTGVATPQFTGNGSGGSSLACKYTMPTYWLRQN